MVELTIKNLELNIKSAVQCGAKYIGVRISTEGNPRDEIIINPTENAPKKLEYYKKAYTDDLTLKSWSGIKIVGFTYGCSFDDIERDLLG